MTKTSEEVVGRRRLVPPYEETTVDQSLIEQIVSNVLAQLQPASVRPVNQSPKSTPKPTMTLKSVVERPAAIELTASVITATSGTAPSSGTTA